MVCTSTFRSSLWFQRTELDEKKQRKNQEYENSRIPYGIWLSSCSNSNVSGNNITLSSGHGIYLDSSDFNSVSRNNIAASNGHGIFLDSNSDYNSVGRNNVTASNGYGVYLYECSDNTIYHNNLVDNTIQAYVCPPSAHVWDDEYPSGGNYWSNHVGVDEKSGPYQDEPGSDGLGDAPYEIDANNRDRYPLMAPYRTFDAGTWNGTACTVDIISNSTVSDVQVGSFQHTISFNVTGVEETTGFWRVTIPNTIVRELWQGNYTVLLNGGPWPFRNWTDATNTYIYVNYTHSEHEITIIQELPSLFVLPLLMIAALPVVMPCRRRRGKQVRSP